MVLLRNVQLCTKVLLLLISQWYFFLFLNWFMYYYHGHDLTFFYREILKRKELFLAL